ncbi:uncharacterized protein LOC131168576 [Malania oleifera]|uniref:uncharacterized protein LOC131168576 n=1 Tax=Malania oleifera TaxID=397392 RepID=UPI0025AE5551|nr:uncharacterized protein LOC131168576 [Malania oleifera]XP_057984093.1 uncharacterized protein LOC131168576 [Malania oleifera]
MPIVSSMSSISFPSLFPLPPSHRSRTCLQFQPHAFCYHHHCDRDHHKCFPSLSSPFFPLRLSYTCQSSHGTAVPSNEEATSVIDFEEITEKDWSFLESDGTHSQEECNQKIDRIISAGEIGEASRVLVSIGSEGFVDRMVDSSPFDFLVVIHDSLLVLALIKEKYDKIKCWQGELIYVPENWTPFDVVFLYFLPALPFKLGEVFEALSKYCLPDARVIISHPQGREVLKQQRQQYPDVIISDLPEKTTLQKVAADFSFKLTEFVDESEFYLAVLKYCKAKQNPEE